VLCFVELRTLGLNVRAGYRWYLLCFAATISFTSSCVVVLCSYETENSNANSTVQILDKESEVVVVSNEGLLLYQSFLTASGICRVHKRHYDQVT
jgi:hypothetical protein